MSDRPHILFLLTDQQRADCLGCAGHPMLRTPNMDRLAAEGVRFTRCYTTSPLCVPARISLVMGLYPHNSNLWQNDATCPLDADTYVKRLREAGYRTCTIGKSHLYPIENCDMYANEPSLRAIGFDHVEDLSGTWGIIAGESAYTDYLESQGKLARVQRYLKELEDKPDQERRFIAEPLPGLDADDYIDAFVGRRVARYVDGYDGDAPSFVYAGFQGPHEPWDAPPEYADRFDPDAIGDFIPEKPEGEWLPERSREYQKWAQYYQPERPRAGKEIAASYFGKIAQIDDAIGRILGAYERKGWLDRTVVIFASDHGEMLGDLARLSKSVFHESASRVPLIVRLPRGTSAGEVRDGFVETIDIHATILDAAGVTPWKHIDSRSLLPLVTGETHKLRDDVLSEVHAHYMLRTEDWKIVIGRDGRTLQLLDMRHDPLEQTNLCEHPDYVQEELEMRSRLLTRIAANTLRAGDLDPELSAHGDPEESA